MNKRLQVNLYCDESCHLEHDCSSVMVLGGVYCDKKLSKQINHEIMEIKKKHGLAPKAELKWVKVRESTFAVYSDLIKYFFNNKNLKFRGIIADKTHLRHEDYNQTHDDWYYKMYYTMLKFFFEKYGTEFYAYLDIKDTHSNEKCDYLLGIMQNSHSSNPDNRIMRIQPIRSEEVQIMQITDVLIGALAYTNREELQDFHQNPGKLKIIQEIENFFKQPLTKTTPKSCEKMNFLNWEADYHEKH